MTTIKRGRVLRDTSRGEGLVFVDGVQYTFRLEGMWRSEFVPRENMPVDAVFDAQGELLSLTSVPIGTVGREHAAQALTATSTVVQKVAAELQAQGLPIAKEWAQRLGYDTVVVSLLLIVAWFWLPAGSFRMGFLGATSFSFYQGLAFLNSGALAFMGGGAGIYGVLMFVALSGIVLPQVWKDRRAGFGMALPLALMLLATASAYLKSREQAAAAIDALGHFGGVEYRKLAEQMEASARARAWQSVSFGSGFYLSLASALYLAWRGWITSRTTLRSLVVYREPSNAID